MTLEQFLSLGETHQISPDEAQKLNFQLSKASVYHVPKDKRRVVIEYLECALNIGSVDPEISIILDELLESLRENSTP